jgi:cytochrome c-type biogenesis protein CcmH
MFSRQSAVISRQWSVVGDWLSAIGYQHDLKARRFIASAPRTSHSALSTPHQALKHLAKLIKPASAGWSYHQDFVLRTSHSVLSTRYSVLVTILLLLLFALPVAAQEAVTDDDVNAIARRMYCPVCENIPLDVCPTVACEQWRQEIRDQLQQGQTPDQVVANFVARYGDRVVGTPQDPTLRALSLATPWLIAALALVIGATIFVRWSRMRTLAVSGSVLSRPGALTDEEYRARLETDLRARR